MPMPIISIIIPVYNVEKYLRRCIDSVLAQTLTDFECIIVDDGSPDGCPAICDEYAAKDNRIVVIHQKNGGTTSARWAGVQKASGEYICFVDADDTIPVDALKMQIERIQLYGLDILIIAENLIKGNKCIPFYNTITGIISPREYIKTSLLWQCHIGPYGRLIKRQLFNDYIFDLSREVTNNEDLIMNLRLGLYAKKIGVFNDIIGYNYIKRKNSASSVKMGFNKWVKVFDLCEEVITKYDKNDSQLKEALLHMKLHRIKRTICLDDSNKNEIVTIALHAAKLDDLGRYEKYVIARIMHYKYRYFFALYFFIWKAKQRLIGMDNHVYWFGW